jgi:hypothetical protein
MTDHTITQIFGYASSFLTLFPFLLGLLRFKTLSLELRVLFLLVCIMLATDLALHLLDFYRINNLFLFHLYTLLEFSLLSYLYYLFIPQPVFRQIILVIGFLFLLLSLADAFYLEDLDVLNTVSTTAEALIMMTYALYYFYSMLKNLAYSNLLSLPSFWINTAVLVYFSGGLFLFIFSNYMLTGPGFLYEVWVVHSMLNIAMNILLGIAYYKNIRQ